MKGCRMRSQTAGDPAHDGETTADNLAYACMLCNRFKVPNVSSVLGTAPLLASATSSRCANYLLRPISAVCSSIAWTGDRRL